jgi:predicted enzyme related to lactoylglutathione lyase
MNSVNYFEIGTPDSEASKTFYSTMFGWSVTDAPSAQGYHMVNNDKGGIWDTSAMGGGNWAIFYVQVDDVHTAIKKAEELGGKIIVPFTNGGSIEFAHIQDPQGNRFGVWRPSNTTA